MNKVQFVHFNRIVGTKKTYAVRVPEASIFFNIVQNMMEGSKVEKVLIDVGHTVVNKSDQYNKKVGRELAESRLTPILFYVSDVVLFDGKIVISLSSEMYEITLNVKHGKKEAHINSIYLMRGKY